MLDAIVRRSGPYGECYIQLLLTLYRFTVFLAIDAPHLNEKCRTSACLILGGQCRVSSYSFDYSGNWTVSKTLPYPIHSIVPTRQVETGDHLPPVQWTFPTKLRSPE